MTSIYGQSTTTEVGLQTIAKNLKSQPEVAAVTTCSHDGKLQPEVGIFKFLFCGNDAFIPSERVFQLTESEWVNRCEVVL
jgi:hypothetical protein